MDRVYKKYNFHTFSVVKCQFQKEIMNKWNYDICVWHPPTFDICPNFLCKRNYVLKQVPTHLLVRCLKIRSFFSDGFPNTFIIYRNLSQGTIQRWQYRGAWPLWGHSHHKVMVWISSSKKVKKNKQCFL